jgi:hypothetical protein
MFVFYANESLNERNECKIPDVIEIDEKGIIIEINEKDELKDFDPIDKNETKSQKNEKSFGDVSETLSKKFSGEFFLKEDFLKEDFFKEDYLTKEEKTNSEIDSYQEHLNNFYAIESHLKGIIKDFEDSASKYKTILSNVTFARDKLKGKISLIKNKIK